jgi:hypothetical protein
MAPALLELLGNQTEAVVEPPVVRSRIIIPRVAVAEGKDERLKVKGERRQSSPTNGR